MDSSNTDMFMLVAVLDPGEKTAMAAMIVCPSLVKES